MKTILCVIIAVVIIGMQTAMVQKNAQSAAELGERLFFDPILSRDSSVSCGTCHRPEFAFADTSAVSKGVFDRTGKRNTPSAMNVALGRTFFWDGRAQSLQEQALLPIASHDEMDLPIEIALKRLRNNPTYRNYFNEVFKSAPDFALLGKAIAAFERTLETSNSAFDRWKFRGDSFDMSASAKRGFDVFNNKGKCVKCHFGADFTTGEFRNIGLFNGRNLNDSGRSSVTGKAADIGKFKTPGLRNIAITAPYMHNGMFNSLEEVIEFYNDTRKRVPDGMFIDSNLQKPLNLTRREMKDLEEFLLSLTDKRFIKPISFLRENYY